MEYWFNKKTISFDTDPVMEDYLNLHKDIKNSQFWYDKIKLIGSDSVKRLNLAMQNLPFPAAFDEAAKALRMIIKEFKSQNKDYEVICVELYKIACIRSLMLDYAQILKMPGYNVMLSIPGGYLFSLKMDYMSIGYEKLELLTKTDKKMLVDRWGEPKKHCSLNDVYKDVWDKAEMNMVNNEKKRIHKIFE